MKIDLEHLPVGIFEDDSVAYVNLESRNMLLQGQPGSGKSVMLSALLCSMLRADPQPKIYVFSPKILDFQNFKGGVTLVDDVEDMVKTLEEIIEEGNRRKQVCIDKGVKKISKKMWEDYPPIIVMVDEYATVYGLSKMDEKTGRPKPMGVQVDAACNRIVAEMRFAAISCVLTTQRFMTTCISSTLRENISGCRASFATNGMSTDSLIWGDWTEEAKCRSITKKQVGCGYIGFDDERPHAFKGAFANDDDEIAATKFYLELAEKKRAAGRQW